MNYPQKACIGRYSTVSLYFSLIAFFGLWVFVIQPVPNAFPLNIFLFENALLLAFLPVIISGSPRGHAWFCFILMPYFILAVLDASDPATYILGSIACLLIVLLFTSAMLYIRWQMRALKQKS